jgi:hypothetical protein
MPFLKTKTTDGNLLRNAEQVPICSRVLENWYKKQLR